MNTQNLNEIEFDLENSYSELLKEAEGCGFDGWVCPIWARIEGEELILSLGDPVSKSTSFVDENGVTCKSWVGNIECWSFDGEPEDYKEYGLESPEDFNRELEIDCQIEQFIDNIQRGGLLEDLKAEIVDFCKEKGYKINFI